MFDICCFLSGYIWLMCYAIRFEYQSLAAGCMDQLKLDWFVGKACFEEPQRLVKLPSVHVLRNKLVDTLSMIHACSASREILSISFVDWIWSLL